MNWEVIGKISVAVVFFCSLMGIIYLISAIVSWKCHVDRKIESQDIINEKVLESLKDIKDTVNEVISEGRIEDAEQHVTGVRCRDCEFYTADEKWCRRLGLCGAFSENDFCSHAEPKEVEDE